MTIIKQYITWQRFWNGKSIGTDISANINNNWNYKGRPITCKELSYGNTSDDKRLLAVIEYDDEQYDSDVIQRMWDSLIPWVATKITSEKALELCNKWYPSKQKGVLSFELSKNGFDLMDKRVKEEK